MDYVNVNDILRKLIQDMIDIGYKKTVIGKLLLGQSGYVPMLDFIENTERCFGIKPLSRLAETLEHEMHIVFIEKNENSKETIEKIDELNELFFENLRENVVKILNDMRTEEGEKRYHIKRKRKSDVEQILNQMLDE